MITFWLSQIARYTLEFFKGDERLIFINAWNEWGEGCHLEPDGKNGSDYLEATKSGLKLATDAYLSSLSGRSNSGPLPFDLTDWYVQLKDVYKDRNEVTPRELEVLTAFNVYMSYIMQPMGGVSIMSEFKALQEEFDAVLNSKYWKMIKPIRKIERKILNSIKSFVK